jgi:rhodanese-related sulfurtransferase
MDPATLAREMGRAQVVDVRFPNEWEAGHIAGAVHIPGDYIFDHVDELDPTRAVVTVCRSGSRSAEVAEELASEGFDVENLDGGLDAWVAEGLPICTDDGRPAHLAEPEPPPDDRPPEMQKLQNDFMEAAFAVRDHFGDTEPSEEEVLAFLRERDASRAAKDGPS